MEPLYSTYCQFCEIGFGTAMKPKKCRAAFSQSSMMWLVKCFMSLEKYCRANQIWEGVKHPAENCTNGSQSTSTVKWRTSTWIDIHLRQHCRKKILKPFPELRGKVTVFRFEPYMSITAEYETLKQAVDLELTVRGRAPFALKRTLRCSTLSIIASAPCWTSARIQLQTSTTFYDNKVARTVSKLNKWLHVQVKL